METLTISSAIQQSEQLNGYYLISFDLEGSYSLTDFLGKTFSFASQPDTALQLFQFPTSPSQSFQFLSKHPIAEDLLSENNSTDLQISHQYQSVALPNPDTNCLILADETLFANAFALAKYQQQNSQASTIVMLHSHADFPFAIKPARFWLPEMPNEAIGASTLLEDWNIVNRMACDEMRPGCYHGSLAELFFEWAQQVSSNEAWQVITLTESDTQKKCLQVNQQFSWLT